MVELGCSATVESGGASQKGNRSTAHLVVSGDGTDRRFRATVQTVGTNAGRIVQHLPLIPPINIANLVCSNTPFEVPSTQVSQMRWYSRSSHVTIYPRTLLIADSPAPSPSMPAPRGSPPR